MPDERTSPSAGWRAVYDEMGVSTSAEAACLDCPDCGTESPRVRRGVFWCPDHGQFEFVEATG